MIDGAGPGGDVPRAPRRRGTAVAAAGALLVIGGGTAVFTGVLGQDSAPSAPSRAAGADVQRTQGPEESEAGTPTRESRASRDRDERSEKRAASAERPVELRIPSIKVKSEVTVVGLKKDGTLEVPQPGPDYDKAAWYKGSPVPGQKGPSVIEGHVDSAKDGPSVFYDLAKLKAGDKVQVTRGDGKTVEFVVDAVRRYPKNDFPRLQVYGNTSRPELRLITCGGQFDRTTGHYRDNTVVFAHAV